MKALPKLLFIFPFPFFGGATVLQKILTVENLLGERRFNVDRCCVVCEKVETVFQFGFTFGSDRFVVASIIALRG